MDPADRYPTQWRSHRQLTLLEREAPAVAALCRLESAPDIEETRERLGDLIAPAGMSRVLEAAREAPAGPDGETARRRLRGRAAPYLDAAVAEGERELRARADELRLPPGGFAVAMASATDPAQRERRLRRWEEFERAALPLRAAMHEAREQRAAACGASGVAAFLAASHSVDPGRVLREFERGAVTPLDDAVSVAARERAARSPYPAGLQRPELMLEHAQRLPEQRVRRVVAAIGVSLGFDPDGEGPRLLSGRESYRGAALDALPRGVAVVGRWPGPAGLRRALGLFGRAARAGFVARERGAEDAVWGDPAFGHAAETLFRRLALSKEVMEWAGVPADGVAMADLRLEESVAPRTAWAYLCLTGCGEGGGAEAAPEVLRRAIARDPTPAELAAAWRDDPDGAAALRGTVLGLLIEEHLLHRFGRQWFTERAAGRWIRDAWADDGGETAETLCDGLDLGTMETAPVLDRCRP